MKQLLKYGLAFASGLVIGGFAMKKYIESKIEYVDDEEGEDNVETETQEPKQEENKPNVSESSYDKSDMIDYNSLRKIKSVEDEEYKRKLEDLRYRIESEAEYPEETPFSIDDEDRDKPYGIPESSYMEIDEYESTEWTLYADGYITNDVGMPVPAQDIIEFVGDDIEQFFDMFENDPDYAYIRNEKYKMDISVVREDENFVDIASPRMKVLAGIN